MYNPSFGIQKTCRNLAFQPQKHLPEHVLELLLLHLAGTVQVKGREGLPAQENIRKNLGKASKDIEKPRKNMKKKTTRKQLRKGTFQVGRGT